MMCCAFFALFLFVHQFAACVLLFLFLCCLSSNQLRIKQEQVNDEMRTKSSVLGLTESIDYPVECQKMLDAIAKY